MRLACVSNFRLFFTFFILFVFIGKKTGNSSRIGKWFLNCKYVKKIYWNFMALPLITLQDYLLYF